MCVYVCVCFAVLADVSRLKARLGELERTIQRLQAENDMLKRKATISKYISPSRTVHSVHTMHNTSLPLEKYPYCFIVLF